MATALRLCLRNSHHMQSSVRRLTPQVIGNQLLRGYADMAFTFASPYEVFYNKADVRQVDVPSYSGDFGILPHHVPSLAVIKPGVVAVHDKEGAVKKFFVSSGTITINEDASVQVLAEEAVPVEALDSQLAKDILSKAQSELNSASGEGAKAEAQIAVEVGEALVRACA